MATVVCEQSSQIPGVIRPSKKMSMDVSRFDSLARSLTLVGSRRRTLAGVLLGSLGLLGSRAEEAAAKEKHCRPCKKRNNQGKCKKKKPDGTVCGPDQVCSGGACIAPACGAGGPCHVFLSSIRYQGNL